MRRKALAEASARLAAVSDMPRLDAELLMAHALGMSREAMLLGVLEGEVPEGLAALVERRLTHEPIAYITGRKAFWMIELEVGPGVLVPRPDSEVLIEAAVAHFKTSPARGGEPAKLVEGQVSEEAPLSERTSDVPLHHPAGGPPPRAGEVLHILDLGTGPGTLLLAALSEFAEATGLGVDASETALGFARRNAASLGLADRAAFQRGNWAGGIEERFDLILCNPPYVEDDADLPPDVSDYEPPTALFAGPDGLDAYRRIVPDLRRLIAPGGLIAVEIGHTQAAAVQALFAAAGMESEVRQDLAGRDRAVLHFALGKPGPNA